MVCVLPQFYFIFSVMSINCSTKGLTVELNFPVSNQNLCFPFSIMFCLFKKKCTTVQRKYSKAQRAIMTKSETSDEEEELSETLMAMLLDSVAPLVKMISLGSAPIRSATCCSTREKTQSVSLSLQFRVNQIIYTTKYTFYVTNKHTKM